MPALSLVNIVCSWIWKDPLLKKHIFFDVTDQQSPHDSLYVGCCHTKDGISYAIGYIAGADPSTYPTRTWDWQFVRGASNHINEEIYHPGDPQFFEKLKLGLIRGHNSLSKLTKCKI